MPYFVPGTEAKVEEEGDDKGNRGGRPIREKVKGIEKDLHNASKGGLLIKNLASNNTRYYGAKDLPQPPNPPLAPPNNKHSHNSLTTPTCGAFLRT